MLTITSSQLMYIYLSTQFKKLLIHAKPTTWIEWLENILFTGFLLPLYAVGFPIMVGATISGESPDGDNVFKQLDFLLIVKDFLIGSGTLLAFFALAYLLWHHTVFPKDKN